jgi:hypothetical protein
MRKIYLLIYIALISVSCTMCGLSENKIKKQAIAIAEKYVTDQLKDAQKTIAKNGIIFIGDNNKLFVIDPSKTHLGLIDDDSKTDAIVSLDCFTGQIQTTSEHLIMISKDHKITFNRAVESDIRIIEIKDRLITADVPSHSRNNPLFNCKSCWEVIKYQFRKGELVKME